MKAKFSRTTKQQKKIPYILCEREHHSHQMQQTERQRIYVQQQT